MIGITYKYEFFDILKKQEEVYDNISYNSGSQTDILKCDFQNNIQQNKD